MALKFSEYEYKPINIEKVKVEVNELLDKFKNAKSAQEQVELVIQLKMFLLNKSVEDIKINVYCVDSLFSDWKEITSVEFDYVIGNPPYVKVQNMDKNYMNKLNQYCIKTPECVSIPGFAYYLRPDRK